MDWTNIISVIGGLLTGGAGLQLIHAKANRRKANAEAAKSNYEADKQQQENDQNNYSFLREQIIALQKAYSDLHDEQSAQADAQLTSNKKIIAMERAYTIIIALVNDLDLHYCAKITCDSKDPELGGYHTKLKSLEEIASELKVELK